MQKKHDLQQNAHTFNDSYYGDYYYILLYWKGLDDGFGFSRAHKQSHVLFVKALLSAISFIVTHTRAKSH